MTTLTKRQRMKLGPKVFTERGEQYRITANIRHDDECGNGHNTFSITCDIQIKQRNRWVFHSGGCCHADFVKHWPEHAHLVKWHLSSTDGPMHYIANAVYLAGDKDHNGRRKGDVSRWAYGVRFGNSPVTHKTKKSFWDFIQERKDTGDFSVHAIAYGPANDSGGYKFKPKYTLVGYAERWHECPFDSEVEALEFCEALNTLPVGFVSIPVEYSDGKERELDKARSVAVWPDATDEELTAPGLKERLEARLPKLLADMRADVEAFGFTW
jgi:hypothetical protein